MRKLNPAIVLFLCSIGLTCAQAMVHSQYTYSLSPTYFESYAFPYFMQSELIGHGRPGLPPELTGHMAVWATWGLGIVSGLILAIFAVFFTSSTRALRIGFRSLCLVHAFAILGGLVGLAAGLYYLEFGPINWSLPAKTTSVHFLKALRTLDTFAFFSGLVGLTISIWLTWRMEVAKK